MNAQTDVGRSVTTLADEYLDLDAEVRQIDEMIKDAQAGRRTAAKRRDYAGTRLRQAVGEMLGQSPRDGDPIALHRHALLVADGYGGVTARHVDWLTAVEAKCLGALPLADHEEDAA